MEITTNIMLMNNRFTVEKVAGKWEAYRIYDNVEKVFTAHFMNGSTKEAIDKYVAALNKKYQRSFERYKQELMELISQKEASLSQPGGNKYEIVPIN